MKLLKPSLGTYSEWILLLSQLRIFRQPLGNLHIFTPRAYKNPILFGRFRICQVETLQVDLPRCRLYFCWILIANNWKIPRLRWCIKLHLCIKAVQVLGMLFHRLDCNYCFVIIIGFIVNDAVFFLFVLRTIFRQGQVTVEAVCLEDFQGTFSSGLWRQWVRGGLQKTKG